MRSKTMDQGFFFFFFGCISLGSGRLCKREIPNYKKKVLLNDNTISDLIDLDLRRSWVVVVPIGYLLFSLLCRSIKSRQQHSSKSTPRCSVCNYHVSVATAGPRHQCTTAAVAADTDRPSSK